MKIIKLHCPLSRRGGQNGKQPISPYDIAPYLPDEECFFDSRHWVVGIDIFPFALTTRIAANCQQYLKEEIEDGKTIQRQEVGEDIED